VFFKSKKSSRPEAVGSDEFLARFIFDRKCIRTTLPRIKYTAFLPNADNGQASVFRKGKMSNEYYKQVKRKVEEGRGRHMKGTALISVAEVNSAGVRVNPEESDYLWHANIEGWPPEKDEVMSIAQEIAANAILEP
jgi:hypothetical protein